MNFNLLKLLESRHFFYIAAIFYKILLDFSYAKFIYPVFSYAGFYYNFSNKNYVFSWVLAFIITIITPNILNKISDYFLVTFSFSLIYPMITLYGFNSNLDFYTLITILFIYTWLYTTSKIRFFNKEVSFPYVKGGEKIFKIICVVMVLYLIFWYIVSGAIRNFNLDFSKVYDFREGNAELTNIGLLAYINAWVLKVFNLSLIAYSLLKKKRFLLVCLLLTQVFFYGVSAHKAVLFYPVVILSIYYYLSKTKSIATLPFAFSILIFFSLYFYIFKEDITLATLFVRRVFFVPSQLTYIYFDFFSNNPKAWWTNNFSILGSVVYPNGIPQAVGNYMGYDKLNANSGFISSAFANGGYYGILIYVLLMTFILKLIDKFSNEVGVLWLALCIVITPLRTILLSSDLLTVLLTHGLFVAILLLFLLRKPEYRL